MRFITEGGPKMAEVKFIPEAIEIMAKGAFEERMQCPVCGGRKDPDKWICEICFKEHGSGMVREVQDAVRKVGNKVPVEVWQNLLKVARNLLSASEKPEGLEDKDLVDALKPKLAGVPEGAIFAALATVRKEMEEKAKEAARKADHDARWQAALSAVRKQFPNGQPIQIRYFIENPIPFKSGFISEGMMRAACAEVINERVRAGRSQLAAAFVNGRLEGIGFLGIDQTETATVSA